jgi:uncharacterized protein (DUF3084 family)
MKIGKTLKEIAIEKNKILLIESFSVIIPLEKVKLLEDVSKSGSIHLIESRSGEKFKALGIVESVPVSKFTENLNNRIYPKKLWEKVYKEKAAEGTLCLADHPSDDTDGSVKDIVGVWRNFKVNENVCSADLYLIGKHGKQFIEVLQAGGKCGLSSVGFGELMEDDKTVNPETYELVRVSDWVLTPSQGVYAERDHIRENYSVNNSLSFTNTSTKLVKENSYNKLQMRNSNMDNIQLLTIKNNIKFALRESNKNIESKSVNLVESKKDLLDLLNYVPSELSEDRQKIERQIEKVEETLKSTFKEKTRAISIKVEENQDLKKKYGVANKVISKMKERHEKSNRVIKTLSENEKTMVRDINALMNDRKNMLRDMNRLIEDRRTMGQDISKFSSLTSGYKRNESLMGRDIKQFMSERKDMLSDINTFSKDRKNMMSDIGQLVEDRKNMYKDLGQLVEDRRKMKEDLRVLLKDRKSMIEDISLLSKDRSSMSKDINALVSDRNTMTKDISILVQERNVMLSDLNKSIKEKLAMIQDLNQLVKDRKTMLSDIKGLVEDRRKMYRDIKFLKKENKRLKSMNFMESEEGDLVPADAPEIDDVQDAEYKDEKFGNAIDPAMAYASDDDDFGGVPFSNYNKEEDFLESFSSNGTPVRNKKSLKETFIIRPRQHVVNRSQKVGKINRQPLTVWNPDVKEYYESKVKQKPIVKKIKEQVLKQKSLINAVKIVESFLNDSDFDKPVRLSENYTNNSRFYDWVGNRDF